MASGPYPWMVETHRTACVYMHMGVYIPTFINFFNFMFISFLLHEQLNDCYKHILASELKSATVFCWEDRTGRQEYVSNGLVGGERELSIPSPSIQEGSS